MTDLGQVTGLVLAAGGSRRLGRPKQLLPYEGATLLDATLDMARSCGFGQLVVALGGAADDVERTVDLHGTDVVRNEAYGTGCSSSIAAAIGAVSLESPGIVLLLGDQPGVDPATVRALVGLAGDAEIAVCRYDDATGHPFWLSRTLFDRLLTLHGDKGVWKLVDAAGDDLVVLDVDGYVPQDVDTWADYETLLSQAGRA